MVELKLLIVNERTGEVSEQNYEDPRLAVIKAFNETSDRTGSPLRAMMPGRPRLSSIVESASADPSQIPAIVKMLNALILDLEDLAE